jgi:uncharacterized membrane protein HdeD (DUF308 family)
VRLRAGELLALIGAACVFVSVFVRSYQNSSGDLTGLDTFGPTVALMLLAAVAALVLAFATITERSSALPIGVTVWTIVFGIVAVVAAIVRVLERPDHATRVCAGAWLALAGAVAILLGAWLSLRDERGSLYDDASPEVRPPPQP